MTLSAFVRTIGAVAFSLTMATAAFGYDLQTAAEDMDNYFVPAYPVVYGEIIDRLPADEVANISAVLKGVEIFGYLKTMGDVANKIDSGDNLGAGLDAATAAANLAITLLKDEATKKVFVAGVGVAALPLTALLTTIDIARKSDEAVKASKIALDLERLAYSIQSDPMLKVKGRKLGAGDPIRIDQTTVEHLWRKIMSGEDWRGLFKTYVTSELGQDWPEPTIWEQWTVPSEHLMEAKLLEERTRLKGHIAGLLREMSKLIEREEARVLLSQQLRDLEAMAGKLSPAELQKALRDYHSAMKELPAIEAYVNGLPELVAGYSSRIAKAPVAELVKIREKEIISELGIISSRAQTVRLLPSVGRHAGKRTELLTKLKKSYAELAGLRNSAGRAEVNSRLIEESKKLAVSGTEFVFTRHECTKIFEDVSSGFDSKVVSGTADAGAAVSQAKGEINQILEKLSAEYNKDWQENDQLYKDKLAELNSQLERLQDQLARTTESRQRSELIMAIERMKTQIIEFKRRFNAYTDLFRMNANIDTENCRGALSEIDTFVKENSNRQSIVQRSLEESFKDAADRYGAFYTNHQSPHQQILSIDEIERLEKIVRDNPDTYAGLSFEFLKKHLVNDKGAPRSQNILQTITGMDAALMTYSNSLYSYRIPYYGDWQMRTLPTLRYMETKAPREAAKLVLETIDTAAAVLRSADRSDFSVTFRERHGQMLEQLESMRTGMEDVQKRLAKANGLAENFADYLDKALNNNAQIAEDSAHCGRLMRIFNRGKQSLSITIAMFSALSRDDPNKILSSAPLVNILEETGILDQSKKLELGIEELVKEPFLSMRGKSGLIDIYRDDFRTAGSKVKAAPVDNYGVFMKDIYASTEVPGGIGIIMERLLKSGNTFAAIFQEHHQLADEAANLYKVFLERRELAGKNQSVIDERKARFDLILGRVNQFIDHAEEKTAGGDYDAVASLAPLVVDVRLDYERLGATRQDVDAAFARLGKMIDDAGGRGQTPVARLGDSPEDLQAVRDLYDRFKEAYEARDDSRVMSFMGDDWEAGDGTTLADMQVNLSRMFRKFDELRMDIQNLQIMNMPQGFMVSYDLTITSRIFKKNLRHTEKSSVREQVVIGEARKVRITRTLSGQYWFVE